MSVAEELERLQALRERGSLSESEHAQAKARVLGTAAGVSAAPGVPPATSQVVAQDTFLHRLTLSSSDRLIGGVCGGLGAHTGIPSWGWRVIFTVGLLYFGLGVLLYVLLWLFIPSDTTPPTVATASPTPPSQAP